MGDHWTAALARYAQRLHAAVGGGHHVASPLGAWLLLALTGPADPAGPDGRLAAALGMAPGRAAEVAAALLERPHPLVAAASGVWHADWIDPERLSGWCATLPATTTFGSLPEQAALDRWAREHTLDLIDSFPIDLTPEVALLLASALASRVRWDDPFQVAPAEALGPDSRWASQLSHVLRTPEHGHRAFVATSASAGEVIVHVAPSTWFGPEQHVRAGLHVVSVAADPAVAPERVLAAAYEIGPAVAGGDPIAARKSLFDLPLGAAPLWTVRETVAADFVTERCRAVLPCWSASSEHDLSAPALGFAAATEVLAGLLGLGGARFEARQAAMARYGRYGFEAAAVTGHAVLVAMPPEQTVRSAELRFGHPYAVVAIASQHVATAGGGSAVPGPWHGVPVFSAWVSDPVDVPEADRTDG